MKSPTGPQPRTPHPDLFSKIITSLDCDGGGRQILLAWTAKKKLRDIIRLRQPITGREPPEQICHALYELFTAGRLDADWAEPPHQQG